MMFSSIKTVFNITMVVFAVALMMIYGSTQTMAAGPGETTSGSTKSAMYEPGMLLKGNNHALYYVAEDGARQFVYDGETFAAFGFEPDDVQMVENDALSTMPLTGVLTRLVVDDDQNLYWAVDGELWKINTWQAIVNQTNFQGGAIGHLDTSLKEKLPIRNGIKNNTFLQQNDTTYFYNNHKLIELAKTPQDEKILQVPPGILSEYPQKTVLSRLLTHLEDTPAAYLRNGPGTNFDIIDTVYVNDPIIIQGRAENSYWLQVKYENQVGWLAGDLVEHSSLFKYLLTINTDHLKPQKSNIPTNNSNIYEGVGGRMSTNRDGIPMFSGVMKGYPAHQAGIEIGDVVMIVDGNDVTRTSAYDTVMLIRGPKDSEVVLTIYRPDTNETLEFAIIRDVINPDTATYTCGAEPIRGFGKAWREHPEVQDPLGCPFTNFRRDEHATRAAVQTYEHGWMLWLETDTVANVDPIYVFFEDDDSFIRYGDRKLVDAHGYAPTPAGFYKVGDRFAKVYWEEIGEDRRQRLGHATNEARDSLGAFQEFENGRMFWAGEADTIYVIYRGYMDLDNDGRTEYTEAWTSFEDTFEASEE